LDLRRDDKIIQEEFSWQITEPGEP
jgi:hypothetical protein